MPVSRAGQTALFADHDQGSLVISDQSKATGRRWYVDSGAGPAGTATGGDTIGHGVTPMSPFLTLEYADSQCTNGRGDIIYVMEGHIEDIGAAETIDIATAGVTVIGLGNSVLKPQFHFNDAGAEFNITGNNIRLKNLKFMPSVTDVLIGIDIEAAVTGTVIEDCLFYEGEDAADEFITTIELKAGCHDTIIRSNEIQSRIAAAGTVQAVYLNGSSNHVKITNNVMVGNWSTAAIVDSAVCTELTITGNKIKVTDGQPGIELQGTTEGIIAGNLIESTGIDPELAIVADDCSWFGNLAVVADATGAIVIGGTDESNALIAQAVTGILAGSDLGEGSQFAIVSNVLSSGIANNAQTSPITAASADGDLLLEEIIVETDNVGWAAPNNIEFSTDNTFGLTGAGAPFGLEIIGSFGANLTVTSNDWTSSGLPCTIESGSIIYIHGDNLAGTGAGDANVTMIFRRITAGATIAAVDIT